MTNVYWPAQEWKRAKDLLDRGFSVPMIAQMIGRSQQQIRGKARWESMTREEREARQLRINENRKSRAKVPSEARYQPERIYEKAPAHVFEERARRQAAHRSPVEELLGVPPPGYSALDRKLNGTEEAPYLDHRQSQLQRKPSLAGGVV